MENAPQFESWKDWAIANDLEKYYLRKSIDENRDEIGRLKTVIEQDRKEFKGLEKKFDKLNTILWTGTKIIGILFLIMGVIIGLFQYNMN